MKIKRKGYSIPCIILCSLLAVVVTLSLITAYQSSVITYDTEYSGERSLFIGDIDRGSTSFEDSEVFSELFKDTAYDITRMCVIKNQMETSGSFDPDKKIDVAAYSNRNKYSAGANIVSADNSSKTGNEKIESDAAVTEYRLDDLIKWGNYGFDLIPVTGTQAQIDAYFYSLINDVDLGDIASAEESTHMNAADAIYFFNENTVMQDDTDTFTEYILVERYKTADKKKITDLVSNRKEYRELVREIAISASDLFNNYNEYVVYKDRYGEGKTNVLFCYQLSDPSGKMVRYSNLGKDVSKLSNDVLSKEFTSHGKYVCFNPDKLQTASTIEDINSVFMKNLTTAYDYSFGEGSRIWLAYDEECKANDTFATLKSEYNKTNEVFLPALLTAVIAFLGYIIIFILMTVKAGKVVITEENGEKTQTVRAEKCDKIPTEIMLVVIICIAALILLAAVYVYDNAGYMLRDRANAEISYAIWGSIALFANLILLPLYLILVRKFKCKLLWKGSITKWIADKISAGAADLYDNGHLAVRIWLPYLLFLALNLVLVLLGAGGIVVAFIIDMVVGYLLYKDARTRNGIVDGIRKISDGDVSHKVDTKGMHGDNLALAGAVNSIGDGISKAVATSMRDEKMKADLITNVSHDIKTPLTSIINYVDLLKRENIEDDKIRGYVDILDQKSQRLKQLTDDLVEASKISSGNISLNMEKLNLVELIHQSVGEFSEKFEEKNLKMMLGMPAEPVYVMADSRGIFRVVENLFNNVYKYALEGTRVYVDMEAADGEGTDKPARVLLSVKNISADPLNISASELTERFMRGDESRGTEGSGLGLSIAKSLTEAMHGSFDISLDGDLFKIVLGFDRV